MNGITSNQIATNRKTYRYIATILIAATVAATAVFGINQNNAEASATTVNEMSVASEVRASFEMVTTVEDIEDEPARYSFASIKKGHNLKVETGSEVGTEIGFYNIDGNRTTHITLEVAEAPEGWVVEVDEYIEVEPTEEMVVTAVNITVQVSDDAEEGSTGEITITATAEWHGQTGQVTICQTRDFSYNVEVME